MRGEAAERAGGHQHPTGRNRDLRRRNLTADDITIDRDDPTCIAARNRIEALIADRRRRAPPT